MAELHRNTKIWLLIIGICVVAIIFFRFLLGIIFLGAIVVGFGYLFYKGIRSKIENFGETQNSKSEDARDESAQMQAIRDRSRHD